jgi:hypothetical protein
MLQLHLQLQQGSRTQEEDDDETLLLVEYVCNNIDICWSSFISFLCFFFYLRGAIYSAKNLVGAICFAMFSVVSVILISKYF